MMQRTVLAMMFIPKRKKSEDNKKKYETKHIRKLQPAWQKEFNCAVLFIKKKQTKCTAPLVGSMLNY